MEFLIENIITKDETVIKYWKLDKNGEKVKQLYGLSKTQMKNAGEVLIF